MNFKKRRILMITHNKNLNNRINNIHERALLVVYKNYKSKFEELLIKSKCITIQCRNIHTFNGNFSNLK